MIKEYIYDWDELQDVYDDRGHLTPDEAAAYLACKEEEIDKLIANADDPKEPEYWCDGITGNINYHRRKFFNLNGEKLHDVLATDALNEATQWPYDFNGKDFTFDQIKDLDPEADVWFLLETLEWSIGRPTWRQIAKNLCLRIYIRIG